MTSLSNDEVYKELLERLEISIVQLSDIYCTNRIDAEYYKRKLLTYEEKVESKPHHYLSEIADFLIGPFGSAFDTENYVDEGTYRYIRGKDVKPFTLMDNDNRYIPPKDYNRLSKYALKENDIMLSVVGTLGNACIVKAENLPAIFSCKSTVIRTTTIMPYCLLAYLNCDYGKQLLVRNERGANQKGLNLPDIQSLLVPNFTLDFQNFISSIVKHAYVNLDEAKIKYSFAEAFLIQELGLDKWTPSREQVSVRNFKDIFKVGRIDAEYYQPKYDELISKVKSLGGGTVKTECNLYEKNFNPDKSTEYKYIELANIGNTGEINGCTLDLGSELPTRARRVVHTGNIIISSIEGSLESCALIPEEYDGALCSTGFFVLDSDNINSETLLVLFKSAPFQALLKQQCTGTILTAFNRDGLMSIPIPEIDKRLQEKVKNSVMESFRLRKKSTDLLEAAKYAVEIAIELDEKSAMEYLDSIK